MTEQQDVLDPRRKRRRKAPAILLGILPAAIAATVVLSGGVAVPAEITAEPEHSAQAGIVERPAIAPGVIAPGAVADVKADVQQITVIVPKPVKKPTPKVTTSTTSPKVTSVKRTTTKKATTKRASSTKKSSSTSYKVFCSNPSNPVTASGGTGKALLYAVNKERAKLGYRSLSWSSSMASTATSWSKSMLAKDLKTSSLIDGLAHNPNRPGAENVAVVYSSRGYSSGTAVAKMHKNLVYSYGHCLNLMNPAYSSMGAGVAHSSDGKTWYATENFR